MMSPLSTLSPIDSAPQGALSFWALFVVGASLLYLVITLARAWEHQIEAAKRREAERAVHRAELEQMRPNRTALDNARLRRICDYDPQLMAILDLTEQHMRDQYSADTREADTPSRVSASF